MTIGSQPKSGPLVEVEQARACALAVTRVLGDETIGVADAAGRVLAIEVAARWDLPRDDVAVMDGYACTMATLGGPVATVVGQSAAGHPWLQDVADGVAIRIATGAVVPRGAEVVVPQEDVRREDQRVFFSDTARAEAAVGRHIRRAGCDVRLGQSLLVPGTRLGPAELALVAASGHPTATVIQRPRVAILATGDELVAPGTAPAMGQLVETNSLMLATACRSLGADVVTCERVPDDAARLDAALDHALAIADVVLTTGGASVGDHDHVRRAADRPGCEVLAWGLALRPGKPTGVVRTPGGLWFALAGNPASTFVAWHLLVAPILRKMAGVRGETMPPLVSRIATAPLRAERARVHWIRAVDDGDRVTPLPDQLSGNLRSLANASVLVRVPPGADVAAGDRCEVLVLDHAPHERPT